MTDDVDKARNLLKNPDQAQSVIALAVLALVDRLDQATARLDRIAAVLERADEGRVVLGGPDAPTPVWPERGQR